MGPVAVEFDQQMVKGSLYLSTSHVDQMTLEESHFPLFAVRWVYSKMKVVSSRKHCSGIPNRVPLTPIEI
jgi:hypothetical protein